jgi:NADPH:quinone reductase-like Zn-dependent oxidoreductase
VATPATILPTPGALDDAEAAALPVAGVTALQALRDHGGIRPGQSVLIIGAAGGVGTYAVQIAVALGADVTGVCSGRNVDMVRALGATRVIDYTQHDFADDGVRYDVIVDNVGDRSFQDCRRSLTPDGVYVMVSGPKDGTWLGPVRRMLAGRLRFLVGRQRFAHFTAAETADELRELVGLIEVGQLRSVIDRRYPLADAADAIRYVATGHARAKVIVDVVTERVDPPRSG